MKEDLDNFLEAKFMLQSLVEISISMEISFEHFNDISICEWIKKNESMFIKLFKLPLRYCYVYKYTDSVSDLWPKLVSLAIKDDKTLETVITPFKFLPSGELVFGRIPYEVKHFDGSFRFFKTLIYCLHPSMSAKLLITDKLKCCFMDKLWKIDPSLRGLAEKI